MKVLHREEIDYDFGTFLVEVRYYLEKEDSGRGYYLYVAYFNKSERGFYPQSEICALITSVDKRTNKRDKEAIAMAKVHFEALARESLNKYKKYIEEKKKRNSARPRNVNSDGDVDYIEVGEVDCSLSDVAGLEEVKEELLEIIDFIKNPDKYKRLGAKLPKGILLYGPPGNGKTLLVRALAGETDVPLISTNGSEFVEKYVGVGAKRIRDLFKTARRKDFCIVFIDEMDSVGSKRRIDSNNEKDQTLNQLLTEMDGFSKDSNILVIGSTNRLDLLDDALIRPGRFDKHIYIPTPDIKSREELLGIYTKDKPIDENVNLKSIASKTHNFSCAEISNMVNEAALNAIRHDRDTIHQEDFEEAFDRVLTGLKSKTMKLAEKEKEIVSYHEAGHAIVAHSVGSNKVDKISIIPSGESLGYTIKTSKEDRYVYTKEDLLNDLAVSMGGRAAEELIFNHISTGAHGDISNATDIAKRMVCDYGMSSLGVIEIPCEGYDAEIYEEINNFIKEAMHKAYDILEENKDDFENVATYLKQNETMTHEEFIKVLESKEYVAI